MLSAKVINDILIKNEMIIDPHVVDCFIDIYMILLVGDPKLKFEYVENISICEINKYM